MNCVDFSLAIVYIVLVSTFLGWALFHRTRERRAAASTEPLLNFTDEGETDSSSIQKDGKVDKNFFSLVLIGLLNILVTFFLSNILRHHLAGCNFNFLCLFKALRSSASDVTYAFDSIRLGCFMS